MEVEPKIVNFFLCVCHGTNVSDDSAYYYIPFETKFNYLVMYSHPTLDESLQTFEDLFANPCSLITGSCPFLPITKPNGKKEVYLPPLLFAVSEYDSPELMKAMGVYHLQIKKNDFQNCEIVAGEHIHDVHSLIGMFGSQQFFTYSSIFKLVESYCKTSNLPLDEISLGILSCQSQLAKYLNKNTKKDDIRTFVPKLLIDNTSNYRLESSISSPHKFRMLFYPYDGNVQKEWSALGTIMTQGCAINVLSFYDIIPENEGRQRVSCLPISGTSIFKLLDYIYNALEKKEFQTSIVKSFMIVRYALQPGIRMFLTMLLKDFSVDCVVIFKLYDSKMQKETTKYSHMGHTISVYIKFIENADKPLVDLFLIDPQTNLNTRVRSEEELLQIINKKYPSKKYIDIIFYESGIPDDKSIIEIHSELDIEAKDYNVITNETAGLGLGLRRGRKSRRLGLGRGRKSRRVTGKGKTQNIVDIIKEVDKQNGIKTAVSNSIIMENPHKMENPSQDNLGSLESQNGLKL